jgi:pimeloyl-ACP methyl ester carboxylesterase
MEILDGRFIANGEKNLYVKIIGNGAIPVIIEPDCGVLSLEWEDIQKELSKHTTVISYDRAGYAESPSSNNPRISPQIAEELYIMLKNSGISGPYLFVGHGIGGLYVQHFAKMYANDVAGMVLVDSVSQFDDEFDKLEIPEYQKIMSHQTKIDNFKIYSEMEKAEFQKTVVPHILMMYKNYPEYLRDAFIEYQSDQNYFKTILNELEGRVDSLNYISQLSVFTNIPIKVLCHDFEVMVQLAESFGIPEVQARVAEELWLKNNKDLLNLSTNSQFEIIKGSGHNIHLDNPAAIIKAILDVLEKALAE